MGFWRRRGEEKKGKNPLEQQVVQADLDENIDRIKAILDRCDDVVYREFSIGNERNTRAVLICLDGLVNKDLLNEFILANMMVMTQIIDGQVPEKILKQPEDVQNHSLTVTELKEEENLDKIITSILSGDSVLFIDQYSKGTVISSKGWQSRGVSEPITESVIRGPRDGFTETLRVNTALIRRRIRDPRLKVESMQLGIRSKTDMALLYIEGIVDPELVKEVKKRLQTIEIDAILDSGYVEQLIEDNWLSPFPQIQNTERPDVSAGTLYEGKVALVVDNSPFVLIMPATINAMMQSPEDYYERWNIGTAVRLLRYFAASVSLVLPALYVAITSFHPQMIPTSLALAMAANRMKVPFPAIVEAIVMEGTIELLREAGVRLPGPIGATIGIVGGLVIGQAAVEAGLVAPFMVIVVAVTAIASFSVPSYNLAIGFRLMRFAFILAGGFMGLYGIVLGILILLIHMCGLKSFGVPYLYPFVASRHNFPSLKDSIIRAPWRTMKERDAIVNPEERIRLKNLDSKNKKGGK